MGKKIQHVAFKSILACSDYLEKDWPLWEQGIQSGNSFDDLLSHGECRKILAAGGHDERSAQRMKKAALDMHKLSLIHISEPTRPY